MNNKLLHVPIVAPWKTIFIVFLMVVGCGLGLPKLIIDGNLEAMLDQDSDLVLELYAVEADFADSHTLLIGVVDESAGMLSRENVALLQRITEDAWKIPFAFRVDSVTNFQHTEVDGDDLYVADLFPSDVELDDGAFNRARGVAVTQPEVAEQLISVDEKMAIIIVNFRFANKANYDHDVVEIMAHVNLLVADYQTSFPQLKFALSGQTAIDYGIQSVLKQDGSSLIPMMLLLMIVILFFFLRSITTTVASVVVVVLTGASTMGLLGWVGIPLDAITCLSPIVIMTLSVADVVHINASVIGGMSRGLSKKDALIESVRYNALPVFLTSLTTVLGVITFVFTEIPSVRNLGIIIAIGVAIAFLLSLTLLPALLSILPMRARKNARQLISFHALADWVIAHRRKLFPIATVVCLGLAVLAPANELNESPELFFKSWTPEKQAIELINLHMTGTSTVDFAIYTHLPGEISTPKFLSTIESFSAWLKTQYGVGYVRTVGDTFKRLNQNMHGDDPQWYRQPKDRELAAQYLLLYEMSLPYGLDLSNQINIDKSGVRITVTTKHLHAADKLALKYKAVDWFADNASSYRIVATGHSTIMEQMVIEHLLPDMLRGGMIAIAMVSFVLFVVLRNWKLGLMGMLANLMPVMMGYGVWSQVNGIANIAVMSVAGICLGVVVDFAVHFLTKYRMARINGSGAEDAVRFSFERVGFPLWTTTVVLVCGFWLLMFSAITLNSSLGALTGIIILLALLFDFIVLPLLLITFDR